MASRDNDPLAEANSLPSAKQFPLLRRFSVASLVAMLVTATTLVFLYRQDQLAEHERISAQRNEQAAAQLVYLLGNRINILVASSEGLDTQALRDNPTIALLPPAQEMARDYDILKLKIYNRSGAIIYSSARDEIGGTSKHPDWQANALAGETTHHVEFRDTFLGASGEMHGIYVAMTYMPLVYAGKRIGAIEVYRNSTPVFEHLKTNTIRIPLIVFGGFALLYAALFFYVRRTDRDVAEWQKASFESEKRLRLLEQQKLLQTSLDGFFVVRTTDGRIIEANDAFSGMLGYSREELLAMGISDLDAGESPAETAGYIRKIRGTGHHRFETRHRHKRGHPVDLEVSVSHSELDGGINFVFARDITERKHAEQQLRKLLAHLQTVREEEKAHLSREIHDELGSILSALKIELHLLDSGLSAEQKKMPQFARVESMVNLFDDALKATRRIITDLRPSVLDDLGLMAALEWQAEQFYKHTGIECLVICIFRKKRGCAECKDCKHTQSKMLSINLFRIFQESLTNVARHSGASRVEAELQPSDHEVALSISDNGCGLPQGHVIAPTSNGMRGMRERVEQLSGKIEFDTPPGGGFRVMVKLPQPAVN